METLHVGLDVGSTTVKIIVLNEKKEVIYKDYQRHYSDTKNTVCTVLENLLKMYKDNNFTLALTGYGAMSAAKFLGVNFIQEVISCKRSVEKYIPQTDVVIELGGEDAKIIYFDKTIEQRMNGTCAGGTGAFLDQMASLLHTDTAGLNELAKTYQTIYPIASRCGVFAKTDIQPLINEGAAKEDIAASIFQAVVNQTISGLACGRPIRGNVAFLGGPLISGLYPESPIVVCYSSIYTTSMTIMAFTIGVYALTTNKQFMSLFSALYNQGTISLAIAVVIYLSEWHFPKILGDAVSLLAKMSTPLCMHILGMRLATVNLLDLFKRPFVYVTSFLKLFIFPCVAYLIVYFLPFFDEEFKSSIFILSGAPCAAVILSLAELHQTEQELSANVVLVSTITCVITLPILTIILSATI